jgi:hypothetical protein
VPVSHAAPDVVRPVPLPAGLRPEPLCAREVCAQANRVLRLVADDWFVRDRAEERLDVIA